MGQVSIKWNSTIILCGDMNIDKIKVNNPAYRLYRDVLKGHGLTQHVTQPTRNNQAILDHISTNIPSRVNHTGVLQCPETSDHDYPYIIFDAKHLPFYHSLQVLLSIIPRTNLGFLMILQSNI